MDQHDVFVVLRRRANLEKTLSKEPVLRFSWQKREKSAIIIWRKRFGYSISTLAKVFQRSTSTICNVLRTANSYGILHLKDYRKMPNLVRCKVRAKQWREALAYIKKWGDWIAAEEDKPP